MVCSSKAMTQLFQAAKSKETRGLAFMSPRMLWMSSLAIYLPKKRTFLSLIMAKRVFY